MPNDWHIGSYICRYSLTVPCERDKCLIFRMTTAFVDFNGVVPEKVRLQVAVECDIDGIQCSLML